MRGIGKIVKPARTLTEDLAMMKFKPDDIRLMAEMAGAPGLIAMGGQGVTPSNNPVSGAPGGAPAPAAPMGGEGGGEKKVERLKKPKGKKPMSEYDAPPQTPAAGAPGGMPPAPAAMPAKTESDRGPGILKPRVPSGKRPAGESRSVGPGNDRLEVILSDLQGLVNESQSFDTTKNALMRSYCNICKIAQAVGDRLSEDVAGNYEIFKKLDELAEEALQVAEGLRDGTVQIRSAEDAVHGYVQDLVEAIAPFADELDIDLTKRLKSL